MPHQGLYNLAHAQTRIFDVGAGDRVLQFSSLSFDASIFEIVMALATGATLCLGAIDSLLPGPPLIRMLRDQRITIATLPPSALAALPVEKLPALRTISVAGEACSAALVAQWAARRRFFNLYGPTEATIWATSAELHDNIQTPPIGRPIANTQIYLLDSHLQPVTIGVSGELHIAGESLARGYLNRPELTAEKFIPNPFSIEPGARLYKTGDLARYRSDGNIEFLGRLDQQVKIRGFRIELGEIEAVLRQHPAVREAVVLAREAAPGEKRLVAYLVPCQKPAPRVNELHHFLKAKLPDYMVPSIFVVLDALPLTRNGKVDYQALTTLGRTRPELTRTEWQQPLAEWNDTKANYPEYKCIHELFETQVERTPDAVAVVFEDKHLTYRELNQRANQLGHHLQALGVGPEVLVGLCLKRSVEMVVGLLGILKAGGAYVSLDPDYPKERLEFMLEDTRAPVLLTQKKLLGRLAEIQNPKSAIELWCVWTQTGRRSPTKARQI